MNFVKYCFILVGLSLLLSCKKNNPKPILEPSEPVLFSNGLLILNEGLFNHNNSELTWSNFSQGIDFQNVFNAQTNRGLGDTGNDLQIYGNKIYIVVNVSNTIEVLDKNTGSSIRQINMIQGSQGKQPRSIVFYQGKGYVSCFDGYVDVIDTATLTVIERIQVGTNPEGLCVSNNKLFVSNSGGLNAPAMDSTVSVVDLNTHEELLKIVVGKNPGEIISVNNSVFVLVRGNYGSIPSRLKRISSITNILEETYNFDVSSISASSNHIYFSYDNTIGKFDLNTNAVINSTWIQNSSVTLYKVQFLPIINQLAIFDAKNYTNSGNVKMYSTDGILQKTIQSGLNPSKAVYLP
jgi:YVTN family beta-propeller protein